jgi:hypothetical protein
MPQSFTARKRRVAGPDRRERRSIDGGQKARGRFRISEAAAANFSTEPG